MKILITSGGTKIPIDMVRDITNMSKGTFGSKIALAALRADHEVVFLRAAGSKSPMLFEKSAPETSIEKYAEFWTERSKYFPRFFDYEYKTFEQYERSLRMLITEKGPDVIVLAAAVSDYYVPNVHQGKIRSNDLLTIKLEQLPKVITSVRRWAKPGVKIIGFKLLVGSRWGELVDAAKLSMLDNNCNMMVANDLEDIKRGKHKVTLVFPNNALPLIYRSVPDDPDYLAKIVVSHIEML